MGQFEVKLNKWIYIFIYVRESIEINRINERKESIEINKINKEKKMTEIKRMKKTIRK